MKETIGGLYWLLSIAMAWVQGGFWWIVLNIFLPIAPMIELAKFILNR